MYKLEKELIISPVSFYIFPTLAYSKKWKVDRKMFPVPEEPPRKAILLIWLKWAFAVSWL